MFCMFFLFVIDPTKGVNANRPILKKGQFKMSSPICPVRNVYNMYCVQLVLCTTCTAHQSINSLKHHYQHYYSLDSLVYIYVLSSGVLHDLH